MDRNFDNLRTSAINHWSLSARRAWIEIFLYPLLIYFGFVAFRKESVDRNIVNTSLLCFCFGRFPQGERG